jgi:hypothetical protein
MYMYMYMYMCAHAPIYLHVVSKLLIMATILEPCRLKSSLACLWLTKVSYVTYHFRESGHIGNHGQRSGILIPRTTNHINLPT